MNDPNIAACPKTIASVLLHAYENVSFSKLRGSGIKLSSAKGQIENRLYKIVRHY